jgi:hypothetical protein
MNEKILQNRENHPSYGQLQITRVSSSNRVPLYGTSNQCRETIRITITKSELCRELNRNWNFATDPLIEIELSPAQFAEAITSLNVGSGVPVTLKRIPRGSKLTDEELNKNAETLALSWLKSKDKSLSYDDLVTCIIESFGAATRQVEVPYPPYVDERDTFNNEFKDKVKEISEVSDELIKKAKEALSRKTVSKTELKEVISDLEKLQREVNSNLPYMATSFNEHMDKSISSGKIEFDAFVDNKIRNLGIEALKGGVPQPNLLFKPEEGTDIGQLE